MGCRILKTISVGQLKVFVSGLLLKILDFVHSLLTIDGETIVLVQPEALTHSLPVVCLNILLSTLDYKSMVGTFPVNLPPSVTLKRVRTHVRVVRLKVQVKSVNTSTSCVPV